MLGFVCGVGEVWLRVESEKEKEKEKARNWGLENRRMHVLVRFVTRRREKSEEKLDKKDGKDTPPLH